MTVSAFARPRSGTVDRSSTRGSSPASRRRARQRPSSAATLARVVLLAVQCALAACGGGDVERVRWISLAEGFEPPVAEADSSPARGRMENGVRRVLVGGLTADGLDVWPGEEVEVSVRVPPGSVLRFAIAAAFSEPGSSATFRVTATGEELFRHALHGPAPFACLTQEIELARAGETTFEFTVEGVADATAFVTPVIGPRDVGTYGRRPWGTARPNVVLFIADTFRADVLRCYGAQETVAPHLELFADRSVRFLSARSTSNWTLPAHASLFTATLPPQNGATSSLTALPFELTTVAERFAAHGYRTGAITDGLFVSERFGMDQGFQWFAEHERWNLEESLDAALELLDRDDGRPVFLVVHTYRMHGPYRVGAEESSACWDEIRGLAAERFEGASVDEVRAVVVDLLDEFQDLYLEGARALDAQWGPWTAQLERRGVLEPGYLVFTSDHGEAFFEHGYRGHSRGLHDELLRVPLLFHGWDLDPRDVRQGASLCDLPRTLVELVGVAPDPRWGGRSLFDGSEQTVEYAFGVARTGEPAMALVQGSRKIVTPGSGEELATGRVLEAFELDADPEETKNLAEIADWPVGLAKERAAEVSRLRRSLVPARSIEDSEAVRQRLKQLGYAGN